MKHCPTCNTTKDDSEFSANRSRSDGLAGQCKACVRAANKKYWAENGSKYAKGGEKERTRKPETEKDRERRKCYRNENRELINARQRERYRKNPNQSLRYREKHKDKIMQQRKARYLKNAKGIRDKAAQYIVANPIEHKARRVVWLAVARNDIPPAKDCICFDCGNPAQHYHHQSYEEKDWLNVVPLCRSCHRLRHARNSQKSLVD